MRDDLSFPELDRAARRLRLDSYSMAESALVRLTDGYDRGDALRTVVRDAAIRRGVYDGVINSRIDCGEILN